MPFVRFHDYFPEIAERETRTVTILEPASLFHHPPGQYGLVEMFCNERGGLAVAQQRRARHRGRPAARP